jgi:hypothetical protein
VSLIRYQHNANTGILYGQQDFCLSTGAREYLPKYKAFHESNELSSYFKKLGFGSSGKLYRTRFEEIQVNRLVGYLRLTTHGRSSAKIPSIVEWFSPIAGRRHALFESQSMGLNPRIDASY